MKNVTESMTIFIPTFKRAHYVETSLRSALAQDGARIEVVVLGNASTDETGAVVASFADPRSSTPETRPTGSERAPGC